ncbi:Protein phosphatase 2C 7 [Rhizina undulata]
MSRDGEQPVGAYRYRVAAGFVAATGKFDGSRQHKPPEMGQDAFFIKTVGGGGALAVGVVRLKADGVGGYRNEGINSADFLSILCAIISSEAASVEVEVVTPEGLIEVTYDHILDEDDIPVGASTACVGVTKPDGTLDIANYTFLPRPIIPDMFMLTKAFLPGDLKPSEFRYSLGAARSGKSLQSDSWDLSPTHIIQFRECGFAGKVTSVPISSASVGGMYWDPKEKSYTKGVDVRVLHQRRAAHFYKVRAIPGSKPPSKKGVLAQKLLGCDMKASLDKSERWHVWGSLCFSSLCKNEPGDITVANIGKQGRTLAFGCFTGIEIFEVIDHVDSFGNWKTNFITRHWVEIPWATMCLPLQTILTGRLWHSELGTDLDYLICSTKEHTGNKKKERTKKWGG